MEEQEATTAGVTRNVADAARGVADITNSIHAFADAAQDMTAGVARMLERVYQLPEIASSVQSIVDGVGAAPENLESSCGPEDFDTLSPVDADSGQARRLLRRGSSTEPQSSIWSHQTRS